MVYLHHQSHQVAMARSGICKGHSTQMSLRRSDCFPTWWNRLNLQPPKEAFSSHNATQLGRQKTTMNFYAFYRTASKEITFKF